VSDIYFNGNLASINGTLGALSTTDGKVWTTSYTNNDSGNYTTSKFSVNASAFNDAAGNTNASATESSIVSIDNTAPNAVIYRANLSGTTLTFTGANFNSLKQIGETASTDIKSRLDWTKLSYDVDSDTALGGDRSLDLVFASGNITSAKVTADGTLTVVLTSATSTSITGKTNSGLAGTSRADSFDVQAGFLKDVAGNACATDAKNNAYGDVIELGPTYGKLIKPITLSDAQVTGGPKTYYYWDRSGNGTSTNTNGGGYTNSSDATSHDTLDNLFNAGKDTTDDLRSGILSGVNVKLITGQIDDGYKDEFGFRLTNQPGVEVDDKNKGSDVAAIWDSSLSSLPSGLPSGWADGNYMTSSYVSAATHRIARFNGVFLNTGADTTSYYVALQVL